MKREQRRDQYSRRDFLRTAGAASAGALLAATGLGRAGQGPSAAETAPADGESTTAPAQTQPADPTVPLREFGDSGMKVSMLSLGGMFDIPNNQLLLRQALKYGVNYWDTADCYGGGRSEEGIGQFFEDRPEAREKVFLVTKSDARDPGGMTKLLERSLERMRTDFIDLYFIHGVRGPRSISRYGRAWKAWAEREKKRGRIRLFGFSTHRNMPASMIAAARAGFFDGIMMTYNYRLMQEEDMRRAVDACREAGIGLTAMKTQGGGVIRTDSEAEIELAGRFLQRGFTDKQAHLKAVWENPAIASICSQMPSLSILMSNIAAAVDRTELTSDERRLLHEHARQTAGSYCAGCADRCEGACGNLPVADVMRYMMYYNDYGDRDRARRLFGELPAGIRGRLGREDFALAESRCPRGLPIGRIVREATRLLA